MTTTIAISQKENSKECAIEPVNAIVITIFLTIEKMKNERKKVEKLFIF